jgi:superfamily II DNA or RNA helicase
VIKLRSYQQILIENIRSQFKIGHNRVIMQSPTGSGKTVVFSYMVKQASEKGKRCLILSNRIEILEQTGGTFEKIGIPYCNITAQTQSIPTGRIMVAMIETMKRRAKARLDFVMLLKQVDICIVDEAHLQNFDAIYSYLRPDCYVIGATATPVRTNPKHLLSALYTSIVLGPSITNLIDTGYLSKPEYFGVNIDLSHIRMKLGEFDEGDMTELYNKPAVFQGLRHNLDMHAPGLKTMIFCPSVASSMSVASELNCLHVDGTMAPSERDKILTTFETTPGSIISNCGITTTGYDCPSIECIVLYRATTSLVLYMQMIGRGSRVAHGKSVFKILDFGMNVQRFGYWHIDRTWSLDPPKKKSRNKDTFPIKFCPQCGAIVSVNVKTCEYCGYVWPVTEKERVFAQLQGLSYAEIQRRMQQAGSVEEMENIRVAKSYKIGYLLHKFTERKQFEDYARLKGYHRLWVDHQMKIYLPEIATV